jgi:Family of unknown function (DUF5808)
MENRGWLALAASLVAAAVVTELRKPPGERTWVGRLGGFVPYDLRPPTLQRVRSTFWAPDNPKILVPHAFGVGWTVNLGRLARLARRG